MVQIEALHSMPQDLLEDALIIIIILKQIIVTSTLRNQIWISLVELCTLTIHTMDIYKQQTQRVDLT